MDVEAHDRKVGKLWFYVVGFLALSFALFLKEVDDRMTYSTYEIDKGKMMRELRSAQTSLGSREIDPRMGGREESAASRGN